jgi:hypothetical protein
MDVPVSESVPSELIELRDELEALVEMRSGHDRALQALDKQIKSKQRKLELLEATQRQRAGQGEGSFDIEGERPRASTQQVRGLSCRHQRVAHL